MWDKLPGIIQQIKRHLLTYWFIYGSVAITLLAVSILTYFFYYRLNPDGVAYLNVAEQYANGNIKQAVNGYWSPLLSWILVPFYWIGVEPIAAFRIINGLLALAPVIILGLYSRRSKSAGTWGKVAIFSYLSSLGILLAIWATSEITPDLLSAVVCSIAIYILYKFTRNVSPRNAVLAGLCLTLLYFSKSAGFYIAIILIVISSIYLLKKQPSVNKKSLMLFIGTFIVISSIWIAAISLKYDRLTISTASSYTMALIGPEHPTHPQLAHGKLPARYPTDTSAWDDPSWLQLPTWHISEHIGYYTAYLLKSAAGTLRQLLELTPLLFIGIFGIYFAVRKYTFLTAAISAVIVAAIGMYAAVFSEPRYLWIAVLPLLIYGFTTLFEKQKVNNRLAIVLCLIFGYTLLSVAPIVQKMQIERISYQETYLLARDFSRIIEENSRVASNAYIFNFCYYTKVQCAGIYDPAAPGQTHQAIRQMRNDGIQYYIDFYNHTIPLPVTYRTTMPAIPCWNPKNDKVERCGGQKATIYKVS